MIVTALFFALSCGKDSGSADKKVTNVEVSVKTPIVEAVSGSQFISITCSGQWTLSCTATWVSFSATSGVGSASIVLKYEANTQTAERSASVVVTCSGKSAVVSITQKGVPAGGEDPGADPGTDPGGNPGTDPGTVQPDADVETIEATDVTYYSAQINGIYYQATSIPRDVGFEWGISSTNLSSVAEYDCEMDSASGSFSFVLSGLSESTTYYYRAFAVIQEGSAFKTCYGQICSFTTLQDTSGGQGGGQPAGDQRGWYELPAMNIATSGDYMYDADNTSNYYAYHICPDIYSGGKKARNYTVCWSAEDHCPLWVAAPRHSMYVGSANRTNAYQTDPDIPSSVQYTATSAGSASGCNRGHMLGSAERTSSTAVNRQVFYMSNIAPQLSEGFNTGGGGWNTLEDWVDGQVCSDTLYVVIGCYFKQFTDGYGNTVNPKKITYAGRSDVSFPTMFYYLLLRTKSGQSGKALKDCTASEIKCAAFVRAHSNNLKGRSVSSAEMMTVSQLEAITGITYFPNVPNVPKTVANASDWGL